MSYVQCSLTLGLFLSPNILLTLQQRKMFYIREILLSFWLSSLSTMMVNLTLNTNNSSEEKFGYKSFYGLSYLSLFLALVCIVVNLLILIKLLLKPHLWSLVIIFLSLLLISNIVYGGTELSLPFLLEIASAQDQVDFLCEVSFWPQIYHITNMSQLCMWIAFLR